MRWGSYRERVGGFEVRLIKASKHTLGIGRFELGVEVHLIVNRINESMQTFAGVGVEPFSFHSQHVVFYQTAQRNPVAIEGHSGIKPHPVENNGLHPSCGELNESLR
ncbi:unannotated protein [freshwater metagenome]|uniref:Unannotated protein n=1 Tax=freshwater metagenome TaxID=449393 RepID=A0A6J7E894_9ZZZZ